MKNVHRIFEVDTPATYECAVWRYQVGHRELLIRAYRAKETASEEFYFLFQGVVYFEGPLQWKNAGFYVGEKNECIALLKKIEVEHAVDAVDIDYYQLYKISLSGFEIKIVAQAVTKFDNISSVYPNLID